MSLIITAILLGEIALTAIILWFVCEFLPMPERAKRICQLLIALIAILAALKATMQTSAEPLKPYSMDRVPSIMVPEKR